VLISARTLRCNGSPLLR